MSEEKREFSGGKLVKSIEFVDNSGYIPKARAILEVVGNLRLVGETGTGKTTLVHKLAELLNVPLFETVLTEDTTRWDLLACDVLKAGETVTRNGIVLNWLLNEGMCYLDGFNYAKASILSLLEPLGDFRGTVYIPELEKTFKRSNKHYLVISYNPAEKSGYSGTFLSNIATIRRFEGLVVDYLDATSEKRLISDLIKERATTTEAKRDAYDFASKFVELARKTRDFYKRGKLRAPLTTGNLKNYALLFATQNMHETDIIDIASSMYPEDERDQFKRLFEESGEIDVEKLKKGAEKSN